MVCLTQEDKGQIPALLALVTRVGIGIFKSHFKVLVEKKKIPVKDRHWAYPSCKRKPNITGLTQRACLSLQWLCTVHLNSPVLPQPFRMSKIEPQGRGEFRYKVHLHF